MPTLHLKFWKDRVRGWGDDVCPQFSTIFSFCLTHPFLTRFLTMSHVGPSLSFVRNMGNFNLFLTHVLTFFRYNEQCCYPSFLSFPTFQAMTSHVANDISCPSRRNDFVTLHSSYVFLYLMHLGSSSFLMLLTVLFFLMFMSPHSLCIGSGIKSI